jgi:putative oxidoreductase
MSLPVTVVLADAGKLLLRLAVGVLLLLHGVAKIASGPEAIVGLVEKAGLPGVLGYAVYLGEVVAAIALVHMGELFTRNPGGGWALELQGLFLLAALAVAMIGPGRYAVTRS